MWKHNQHNEMVFSVLNIHFGTSNYNMQQNKCTSYKHLFGLLSSKKPKQTRTDQSTLQVSCSVWKEATHKPSKVATEKNVIFSVYVIGQLVSIKVFYSI